jgi:hypothetical protein
MHIGVIVEVVSSVGGVVDTVSNVLDNRVINLLRKTSESRFDWVCSVC